MIVLLSPYAKKKSFDARPKCIDQTNYVLYENILA
jgi:hypothetical protein